MEIYIHGLEENNIATADEVLASAFGGPSRVDDLRLYRQIQPDGWFVAEKEGSLVGTAGAAIFDTLAHVGLVAVRPQYQKQGIGQALMDSLLARLEQQVPLVTLDASEKGRPLYEKLGFVPFDETCIFQRPTGVVVPPPAPSIQTVSPADVDELARADQAVFGAERRKVFQVLLENFPSRAFLLRDGQGKLEGYLFAQKFRIGPWVMFQPQKAEVLLQAALRLTFEGIISLTVPSSNPAAIDLLHRYGFERVRTNRRMGKGSEKDPCQRENIYSQMSLAVG